MKFIAFFLSVSFLTGSCSVAQQEKPAKAPVPVKHDLRRELQEIIRPYGATVGISVLEIGGDSLTVNNSIHYCTMSTYKFPLGMAVMERIRKKELSLDQNIHVTRAQLHPGTYSPLRDKFPEGDIDVTVADLLYYAVSLSDNNATDVLFELMGGTQPVEAYIHGLGFRNMEIRATEYEMGEVPGMLPKNRTTPYEMSRLLAWCFDKGPKDAEFDYLAKLMFESPTGKLRIRGMLPDLRLAHKTGTSGTDENGLTVAVNDIGVLYLPNGKRIALAVYVGYSKETFETNEYLIAKIAKTVYDHYAGDTQPSARSMELTDPARGRKIPVVIYESGGAGNGKVAVLSGGYKSVNTDYSFIANHLAEEGYVVFSLQHDLEGDPPMAQEGDVYALRKPVWENGVASIRYVIAQLKVLYPNRDFSQLVLIGHSNGGDMSMLFAQQTPEQVKAVFSLDHRRMPVPLLRKPQIVTLRSGDFKADPGVLPSKKDRKKYGIRVVEMGPDAKHGDLCDKGSPALKKAIVQELDALLHTGHSPQ